MTIVKKFISSLVGRLRKENDLSDIIWALTESSPDFKRVFIRFFFQDLKDDFSNVQLLREYSRGNSRPDFFFEFNKTEYLIEIKIYDRNTHFEQYECDFPNAKKAWIANYGLPGRTGYTIKTWEEFYQYLEKVDRHTIEFSNVLEGLNAYLKSVCSIIKFQKMNLSGLSSLFYFNNLLVKLIESEQSPFEMKIYWSAKSYFVDRSGLFFTIKGGEMDSEIQYPWIGIYYNESKVVICMGFSVGWCKRIYNGIYSNKDFIEGKTFEFVYEDDNNYWFEMKKSVFNDLNEKSNFDEQKELLKSYFDEVLDRVSKYF